MKRPFEGESKMEDIIKMSFADRTADRSRRSGCTRALDTLNDRNGNAAEHKMRETQRNVCVSVEETCFRHSLVKLKLPNERFPLISYFPVAERKRAGEKKLEM